MCVVVDDPYKLPIGPFRLGSRLERECFGVSSGFAPVISRQKGVSERNGRTGTKGERESYWVSTK